MAVELGAAYISILPSTSKLAPELYKSINKTVPKVGNQAGQTMGSRMASAAGRALKAGAAVGVAAAGAAIGAALVGGFRSAIDQQKIQATVGGLYQDGDKAYKTLEKIKKLSSTSPIDYSAYGKAAQSLAYAGVEGDQAVSILDKVGWAIVGAGGGATELDRAMNGILKGVNNGGVVMNDTLAMISESGYPIIDGLSAKFGTTGDVIKKMAAKGEISIDDVLSVMENGTGKLAQSQARAGKDVAKTFGESFKIAKDNIQVAIGETMIPLLEKLAPMMKPISDAIVSGIQKLPSIFASVTAAAKGTWTVLKDWAPMILAIVGAVVAWNAVRVISNALSWAAYVIEQRHLIMGAARIAITNGMAAAQAALNAVMTANPIGLIVAGLVLLVGAFIMAYKKVGWFRDMVNAAWAGIKIAAGAVAGWFMTYVWPVMQAVWNGIVVGAKWLWAGIKLVWNGIMVAVRAVVAWFQTYVAPVIKAVFSVIGAVFRWLWKNIAVPVFNGIKLIVTTWWKGVKIIFNAVISFVKNYLAPVFQLFWAIIKTVWNGIKSVISTVWNFIRDKVFTPIMNWVKAQIIPRFKLLRDTIKVVWSAIKSAINTVWVFLRDRVFAPIVRYVKSQLQARFNLLRDTVKTVWAGIKTSISTVWNFVRDKVFDPLKNAIKNAVPDAFEKGKDAIKRAWDKVRDIAKKPVKFMISTVINSGIIKNFNKIASKFGVKKMPYVQLPKGFSSGGWTGAGSKYKPAGIVHADEFVIQKSSRRRIERQTPGALDYMNKTGRLPELGGYAKGGAVWSNLWRINKEQFPNSRLTSSVRNSTTVSGNKSLHASGMAIDVAGPRSMDKTAMMKMATWWRNNYGSKLAELIYTPLGKKQIKNGQNYQYTGAVAAQHKNHVHIAARKAMDGKGGLPGGGGGTDWMSWLNPFKKLKDIIKNKMPKAGAFGDVVASGAKKMVQAPIDWIKEKASALFDFAGDVGTKVKDVVTSGVGRTRGKAWAKAQGWPIKGGARWKALDYIVTHESSWNPKAKNPSSTASGLGQFINSTSRHYMGGAPMSKYPFDKQLAGVVRYTSDRYGGLVPAMNFWKKHHYYAKGTLSAARGWATVGENGPELIRLRGGEQIKSNRNSKKFIDEHTDDKGRVVLNVNFNGRVDDPNEAVNKLQFEVNRLFTGGKYR